MVAVTKLSFGVACFVSCPCVSAAEAGTDVQRKVYDPVCTPMTPIKQLLQKLLLAMKQRRAFLSPQTQKIILVLSFLITMKLETVSSGNAEEGAVVVPQTLPAVDSTTLPYTELIVTRRKKCDAMLCKIDNGVYLVNTTACTGNYMPSITTSSSFTVRIMTEPEKLEEHSIYCVWKITGHKNHYTTVSVMQQADGFGGNYRLTFKEIFKERFVLREGVVNSDQLKYTHFSFPSIYSILVVFQSGKSYPTQAVTLYVSIKEGSYMRSLPVVMLSKTVGYVTSPGFGRNKKYPNNYDGECNLNVAINESLLINFVSFHVQSRSKRQCSEDLLLLRAMAEAMQYPLCQWKNNIMAYVFRSSLNIYFHTDGINSQSGFKMMFTVLPRGQEPEQFPSKLFNCSVPSFHRFKPVFSCNLLTECEGGEDEQDCGHRKNECGLKEAIDAGIKCYILVFQRDIMWQDALKNCIRRGYKLATLGNPEEYRRFQALVPPGVNLKGYFVGAQLMDRLQSVAITSLYRNIWQWVDGRTIFSVQIHDYHTTSGSCAMYDPWLAKVKSVVCHERRDVPAFVCEFYKESEKPSNFSVADDLHVSVSVDSTNVHLNEGFVECSLGHVTRGFLSCDVQADCDASYSMTSCSGGGVTLPMFVCQQSRASVHYSLVCDQMQHCSDNSDEDFCHIPECPRTFLKCRSGQCIHTYHQCDGKPDCYDGFDEYCRPERHSIPTTSPPGAIHLDGKGNFLMQRMHVSDKCPPTHFLCPHGFCLPVYLRCNGVDDCFGREDEMGCDRYKCRGYYRCRGSKTCLHASDVCDGVPHCPDQDDEMLCDLTCPDECRCQGLAFVCTSNFSAAAYPALRYLDASTSNMTLSDIRDNIHFVVLRLSKCQISCLPFRTTFPNLRELDLSWNFLHELHIKDICSLNNLKVLVLTGNPLVHIITPESPGSMKLRVEHVDLSYTGLEIFSGSLFGNNSSIKLLNISWSKLRLITEDGFQLMPQLETLDLSGCHLITFPRTLLKHLTLLKSVHAENYKLCCEAMLPINFKQKNCHATHDLLASCEDLLKSNSYRIFLWVFASLSVVGNLFSVLTRLCHQREDRAPSSFSVFVTSLSVADLFMGIYLAIIGTADLVYRGHYLWRDDEWKNSTACNIAGFLCLLSSEVSAFIICLITLDRFLVLRFPFGRLHFGRWSAVTACGVAWATGMFLAIIPLLPVTSDWEFYSQTGICIPLPFTSSDMFRGYDYSFSISILLNLVLFLLIAVGQAVIYRAVRANSMPSSSTNTRTRDAAIARRLITVVVSDFLCWFPVGLLGLLASTGNPIPGYLNVAVAVFVLPVNSALNPFLYTFNLLMEKRRKAQYEKMLKRLELERRSQTEVLQDRPRKAARTTDKVAVIQQIKLWIVERLLTPEDLMSCSSSFGSDTGN